MSVTPILTLYSKLPTPLWMFCLRTVMCSSLSFLICVCMIPNRWNISCSSPPLLELETTPSRSLKLYNFSCLKAVITTIFHFIFSIMS